MKDVIAFIIFLFAIFILISIVVLIGMLIYAGYSPNFSLQDITFNRVKGLAILFFIALTIIFFVVSWIYIRMTCEHDEWEKVGEFKEVREYFYFFIIFIPKSYDTGYIIKCKRCGKTEKIYHGPGENSN